MNDFEASTTTDWTEAETRVRAYLQALQIQDPAQQDRIAALVLQRAAQRRREHPEETPTVLAMKQVRELSAAWLGRLLANHERVAVTGMVSLFAIDAPRKWPDAILAEEVPADFQRALQSAEINAAPNLKLAPMVPQPFDNPLRDMALPNAIGELTKNLSPSIAARGIALVVSALAFLSGNRMR